MEYKARPYNHNLSEISINGHRDNIIKICLKYLKLDIKGVKRIKFGSFQSTTF